MRSAVRWWSAWTCLRWKKRAIEIASGLLVAAAPATAADDAARAEQIVQGKCFICHGIDGESSSPLFPRLAGQHARYIERQLADYKSGKRASSTMGPMVEDLSAADFKALGAYFESRRPQARKLADPELAQVGRFVFVRGNPNSGVAACADCHGAQGGGTETLPRLAGQHAQYTENQLRAFSKRERSNDDTVMHGIANRLSELEMKAVAAYLSGLE
jgi:cytochrome c553